MVKKKSFGLAFRIGMVNVLLTALIMAAIGIYVASMMSRQIEESAKDKIHLIAQKNASMVANQLNMLEEQARVLSKAVINYSKLDPLTARRLVLTLFTETMQDGHIFGIYQAVEPNAYYSNTPDGYSFYAYRDEYDRIVYESYAYDDYKDGEFYIDSKTTLKTQITEPYCWTLTNGEEVWLVTISVPMLDENGKFIGVTNCDISVDTLLRLEYDNGGYENAYSYILTDHANYAVHTREPEKFGMPFEPSNEFENMVMQAALNAEESFFEANDALLGEAMIVQSPLHIGTIDTPWSSIFLLQKDEVLMPVRDMILVIGIACVSGIFALLLITSLYLRRSLKPVQELVLMAEDIQKGVFTTRAQVKTKDELGRLAGIFNLTADTLNGYISEIAQILGAISKGDLTQETEREYLGSFTDIKLSLATIREFLNSTFQSIGVVAGEVTTGALHVADGAQSLSSAATEQAAVVEELSSTISLVYEDVKKNTENVAYTTQEIDMASANVVKSNAQMQELLKTMGEINDASNKISGIIKIIEDISFQTNILALNAAVEAARAGAAGKGFAVVAGEVRNLAAKSADAAQQTTALIHSSIDVVNAGLHIARQTASALNTVSENMEHVQKSNEAINAASQAQYLAISEINSGLHQLSGAVETIAATSEENAAAGEALSGHAKDLYSSLSEFKTKQAE